MSLLKHKGCARFESSVRFEVLTVELLKMQGFLVVTPCHLAGSSRHFEGSQSVDLGEQAFQA